MASVSELLAKLPDWNPARDALRELAKLPLATKRKEVYPRVIELAVKWWCVEEGKSDCGYEVDNVQQFLAKELDETPELANQVFEAIGKRAIKLREHHFYTFARKARDRRAARLLRGMWKTHAHGWADAVLAIGATELADDVLAALTESPYTSGVDLPIAAGHFGGERAIKPLLKLMGKNYNEGAYAIGLVLAGHEDDELIKELSTGGEGATAKRLYAAFHKPKQKDRLAALEAIGKDIPEVRKNGTKIPYVSPGALLGFCKLFGDHDPVIAERAAVLLSGYPGPRGEYQLDAYFPYFLEQATAVIARGVSPAMRKALEVVRASIPRAPDFAKGPVAKAVAPEPEPVSKKLQKGMAALAALKTTLPAKASTHRDPALEAEIAEAPDDESRYLVYADWLQTQGDPRGTLITLQAAAKTGDKTAESTAVALLVEQRHALLGLLDGVKEIDLEWQFGFVRGARLKYPNQKKLLAGLKTLLEANAARFLQSIVIDPLEDKSTPDAKPLVDLLVEHAPKTISHLQVGKAGKWTIPDELRVAFPRLERDPLIVWEEVVAKIAEQKRLEIRFLDAKKLPKLEPRTGKPALDPQQILVGLRAEVEKSKPIGIVGALPRVFTKESVDAFAHALVQQWMKNDDQAIAKFAFDCSGLLGGEHTAKLLGENLATWSHARAVQAVEHLKRIGSDVALYQIARLVLIPDFMRPRRDAATELFETIAKARGGSTDDLLAEIVPVDDDLYVQRAWLTRLLVHGPRIVPETFARGVAGDKIRGSLATLVWGTFSGKQLNDTFAVARDGTLRTSEGKPFELGEGRVGLVHPLEMTTELLETWRDTFARRELDQVIPQLDRPTFRMSPKDADTEELDWFEKRRAGFSQIDTTLLGRDWSVHEQYDQGGTESYGRFFARSNVTGVASFGRSMGSIASVRLESGRYERRKFSNIDAVTISELLYDLESAHGFREAQREAPAPATQRRGGRTARAAGGPAPIVERAKTGRAKCVVCEQPIAKGDPRVGVERQIQTDTFTGRGTVWSHPACREGMPELEGVDVEALVAKL